MAALATTIALGVALFVATNLDDIFILLVFCDRAGDQEPLRSRRRR